MTQTGLSAADTFADIWAGKQRRKVAGVVRTLQEACEGGWGGEGGAGSTAGAAPGPFLCVPYMSHSVVSEIAPRID
jgi:hypothetical protein